jgi:hypothetical protein
MLCEMRGSPPPLGRIGQFPPPLSMETLATVLGKARGIFPPRLSLLEGIQIRLNPTPGGASLAPPFSGTLTGAR